MLYTFTLTSNQLVKNWENLFILPLPLIIVSDNNSSDNSSPELEEQDSVARQFSLKTPAKQ